MQDNFNRSNVVGTIIRIFNRYLNIKIKNIDNDNNRNCLEEYLK